MENHAEIYEALLSGKTIKENNRQDQDGNEYLVKLINGNIHSSIDNGQSWYSDTWEFWFPKDWAIIEAIKGVGIIWRYFYFTLSRCGSTGRSWFYPKDAGQESRDFAFLYSP